MYVGLLENLLEVVEQENRFGIQEKINFHIEVWNFTELFFFSFLFCATITSLLVGYKLTVLSFDFFVFEEFFWCLRALLPAYYFSHLTSY